MGLIYLYKDRLDYGSGNRGFVLRIPLETRDPALLRKVQSASRADPASYSIDRRRGEGGGLLGGKSAAREADSSTVFSAKVKNEWSHTIYIHDVQTTLLVQKYKLQF